MTVREVSATVGVLWVVYWVIVVDQSCPWTVGRPRLVIVVLVVLTLRLLVMPGSWRCVK